MEGIPRLGFSSPGQIEIEYIVQVDRDLAAWFLKPGESHWMRSEPDDFNDT